MDSRRRPEHKDAIHQSDFGRSTQQQGRNLNWYLVSVRPGEVEAKVTTGTDHAGLYSEFATVKVATLGF